MKFTTTRRRGRIVTVLALGALIVGSLAGYAAATSTSPATHGDDRAAATEVALTKAERVALDRRVQAAMATAPGGKRVGVNQVAWEGGDVVLTVPLPGEKQARATDESIGTQNEPNCAYTYVCLYDDAFFRGDRLAFQACKLRQLSKYGFHNRTESWHNNQTRGTYSHLFYWSSSVGTRFGMGLTLAPSAVGLVGKDDTNRADYIDVC